ncbi:PIG-P-domain-containing protein [Dendryphion nanum]|uniref:PIG-P-domain-containing protein n=1 Tax=Dendryphion nanum TaxID=256645 RepID=A0A9P9DDM5_9PLEO|nr:PIG-P-domain-containing protein [Dendryphion nanum]
MPPQSRGTPVPSGFQSKSTPNLPTLRSIRTSLPSPTNNDGPPPSSNSTASSLQRVLPPESASLEDENDETRDPLTFDQSDDEDSDSDDAVANPPTARPLYTSRSQTHLPPHTSTALFPPFYNRPPTPLPPSPSLTSLLRPSFSATNSRPTTPDSSDVEVPAGTRSVTTGTNTPTSSTTNLASITKSARYAAAVPRASPKVPTYEYYGFALYLASSVAFLLYIIWAYVPSPVLHQMGIHYYPNRWWALAVPCWLVALIVYIYVALASYNTQYLTLPLTSCENLVDECGQIAVIDTRTGKIVRNRAGSGKTASKQPQTEQAGGRSAGGGRSNSLSAYQFDASEEVDWKRLWSSGTDAVLDVPIGGVCEILYGSGRDVEG